MPSSDESAPKARGNGDDNNDSEFDNDNEESSSDDDLLFKFPQRGGESVLLHGLTG